MPIFKTERRVAHKPAEMFDLVADVEKYPEFVPLCQQLRVRRRVNAGDGGVEILVADMTVAYKMLRESFTSRVTLDRPRLHILAEYLDGPFSRLENHWRFSSDGEATVVSFSIDYEFRSRALALVMGAVFDAAFRRFAEAFEARADAVYGAAGPATAP
ncbi:type II toxin-antitoxin system RatA family toxin [Phreatobacter sp. AB_2022a]|uniref:type II toxin-antitoxin system RatA family toxin n=1 Tax=Phreatobacter sp. AB_2022a TaxID=3003134 RepID=UPI002286FB06|nr:type II toxin-antitoxin system RatA family toxin [Phreatobacter sp. AB_2022a]MCZ0733581.1 type II toxin-antitoxin system RatA family toxin [Phreatobacter sp. AB_2022a]